MIQLWKVDKMICSQKEFWANLGNIRQLIYKKCGTFKDINLEQNPEPFLTQMFAHRCLHKPRLQQNHNIHIFNIIYCVTLGMSKLQLGKSKENTEIRWETLYLYYCVTLIFKNIRLWIVTGAAGGYGRTMEASWSAGCHYVRFQLPFFPCTW